MKNVYIVLVCLVLLMSYGAERAVSVIAQEPGRTIAPAEAQQIIAGRARQVISALKAQNLVKLSGLVHSRKGLRFSPYNSVNKEKAGDRVFTRREVANMLTNKQRYLWGEEDGSGDPIRLTYAAYHRKYIYDHDYSKAKQITYNSEALSSGNLIKNIRQSYPQSIIVEFHFPGFQEKYGGMDWTSLWLVFEKRGRQWFPVGIVHGEWTI